MHLEFPPRTLLLRDGLPVRLRPSAEGDAAQLLAFTQALAADGRGMVLLPDELGTEADMAGRVRQLLGEPGSLQIIAERDGCLMGEGALRRPRPWMVAHNATLGMGVHPRAQGLGLGRALLQALLDWAGPAGIERVELFVRADNARAIALYTSLGFTLAHVRRRFVRLPDGRRLDDLAMERYLNP